MKKQLLFVAALALTFAACNKNEPEEQQAQLKVADFENIELAAESTFAFATDTTDFIVSGDFMLQQTVAYGGSYVTGAVVSNITDTNYESYLDANKSVAGGAYEGKNYVVWYNDSYAPGVIKLNEAAVIPGFYVCNNVYAYASMTKGDSYAGDPFGAEDYFTLTINGSLNGEAVNAKVDFDLARGTNIVTDWTYVDLSALGEVDEISFTMTGSRTGDYGLNTPTYFCIDNLGAKK